MAKTNFPGGALLPSLGGALPPIFQKYYFFLLLFIFESGDPAECYRHKKLCKNDQLRCASARGASKHFLHSHGRNFCSILFKFGHDVACSHPKGQRLKQIFQGGPSSPHKGGIAPYFSKILFFSFVV